MNKEFFRKNKKIVLVCSALLLIALMFLVKTTSVFKNERNQTGSLVYSGNEKIEDLVNRDTDGDSIPDWEEGLFGTDPTKADTNDDGIPDDVEISKRRGQTSENGELNLDNQEPVENLTETDKLSRELFSTLAALNQAGQVDQTTVEKLSQTLAEKIQGSPARKTFTAADVKTVSDSWQTVKNYNDTLAKIYEKYPYPNYTTLDVLQKFLIDENNVDESVLPELDPIIGQTGKIITEVAKMDVPQSLVSLHLDLLNGLEKVHENISDIRLYDTDIVIALGGISQYETSADNLGLAAVNLATAINQKLN